MCATAVVLCTFITTIKFNMTDNYFVVSSTVGNVGLCNPAHLIGLCLECMACTLGDCSTSYSYKTLIGVHEMHGRMHPN